jgi:hypothetical protein
MQTDLAGWTEQEQVIAREAFDRAYSRAVLVLIEKVKQRSELLESAEMLWHLHDFLSIERHTMEGRFDFRLNGILFVFASLVKDGLLQMDELAGLAADKQAKISAMSLF